MKANITEEQAIQIATNAVNASVPMGLGFLHHEAKDYTETEVIQGFPHFDYFHGRMVKLDFRKDGEEFVFPDYDPDIEYQSWAGKYPTYRALVESVVPDAVFS